MKRTRAVLFWLAIWSVVPALATEDKRAKAAQCTRCLGDICFDRRPLNDSALVRRHGPGRKEEDQTPGGPIDWRTRCYYDGVQRLWLQADIYHRNNPPHMYVVGAKVSAEKICDQALAPRQPFPPLQLTTGLRVGDRESRLRRLCGPADEVRENAGGREYIYTPEGEGSLLFLSVTVRQGKVVALWLNDSP